MNIDQTYAVVPIDSVCEHPQNPRIGNEDAIADSIEANGWYGTCVVQKSTGYILAGNHRHRVAKQEGATEIAVVFRDLDDETALRILLADNRTADLGTYDEALLQQLLDGLEDLSGTGWSATLEQAVAAVEIPDALPVPDEIPDDKYVPQWAVMVVCDSEDEQRRVYESLAEGGYADQLRVVAV